MHPTRPVAASRVRCDRAQGGRARINRDEDFIARFAGAERAVEFEFDEAVGTAGVIPLSWRFVEYSPFNPARPTSRPPESPDELPGGDLPERLMRTPARLWQALATLTAVFE